MNEGHTPPIASAEPVRIVALALGRDVPLKRDGYSRLVFAGGPVSQAVPIEVRYRQKSDKDQAAALVAKLREWGWKVTVRRERAEAEKIERR